MLWITHHSFMAVLFQMKIFDIIPRNKSKPLHYSSRTILIVQACLLLITLYGFYAFIISNQLEVKITGLVSLFFGPIFMIQWFFGHPLLRQNWKRIMLGGAIPSIYTVILDSFAQNQSIWNFPLKYRFKIDIFGINFDLILIYIAATFAVTLACAILLSAAEIIIFESKNKQLSVNIGIYDIIFKILRMKGNEI